MKLSHRNDVRTGHWYRLILSVLVVLAIVTDGASQVRRRIEISRVINPSPVAGIYFRGAFRFGGGVVPRGAAEFVSPSNTRLSARQLELVILDGEKLRNGRPDYDAIGIRWRGQVYKLAAQDDLIYPMMKFIQRGSYIAYTIPPAGFDKDYFEENALVPSEIGFVAKEFELPAHAEFLFEVDFAETEELASDDKTRIMKLLKDEVKGNEQLEDFGSYVNADFHITYKAFFNRSDGKRVVDVGGLPLRYVWNIATDGSAVIDDIEVFTFPEEEFSPQDRAVIFFQTAAILRQFNKDNKPAFNRFLRAVGTAVRRQ